MFLHLLGGLMEIRRKINSVFGTNIFERPLFYSYPGGLRFGLSEDSISISQFLLAIKKATIIRSDIFQDAENCLVCLRTKADAHQFAHRKILRELKAAGIKIPKSRSIWLETSSKDDWFDKNEPEFWLTIAFEAPINLLQNFLWCAVSTDFGHISPRPLCSIYLVNLSAGVVAFPYDDRGMDVVGSNQSFLANLYRQHHKYLLTYDLKTMEATFGTL
jgi:Domain of unknown function (DUF3885)